MNDSFGSQSKPQSEGQGKKKQKPWQQSISPWVHLLYWLLIPAIVFCCLWNIGPYEVAARLIGSRFEGSALITFLFKVPVLNWVLGWIGNAFFWIAGAIIWSGFQLIELFPVIMANNPGYVRHILGSYESQEKIRVNQEDPGFVKYLKNFYANAPLRFLLTARTLRGWIYALDILIVMTVYPPVSEGGVERLFFILSTQQWGQLDWGNIVLMISTVAAVELIFSFLMVVIHFRIYLRESAREARS